MGVGGKSQNKSSLPLPVGADVSFEQCGMCGINNESCFTCANCFKVMHAECCNTFMMKVKDKVEEHAVSGAWAC